MVRLDAQHKPLRRAVRVAVLFAALLALAALAAAACGGGGGERQKVTLALDWFKNPDHAGILVAQAKGFFAEEGLEVTLQEPGDPADPPKFVATGRVDIAISYQPDVLLARSEGIPIVAVGAIVPKPLNSIQVLRASGITHPKDLAGKTVGTPGIPANSVYLKTILTRAGVDPSRVKEVDIGFELVPALVGGRVDAIIGGYWNVEAVEAELQGKPVTVFHLEEFGVPEFDELVFIASEKGVREKKDLLERFLRAVAKGHRYVVEHPEESIAIIIKESPEYKPELIERSVRLLLPLWQTMADDFGRMDQSKWQAFAGFLYDNKLVSTRLRAEDAMTNEFLPGPRD